MMSLPKALLLVFAFVLAAAYAGLFISWNGEPILITTWKLGVPLYEDRLPVGILPLAGVVVGLIITAVAVMGPYRAITGQLRQAQRERDSANDLVEKAKARIRSQKGTIAQLEKEKGELEAQLAQLGGEQPAQEAQGEAGSAAGPGPEANQEAAQDP